MTFKEEVYDVVKKIHKGSFLTYKAIAKKAGYPKAWRVVGNILNKNKNPKIPCHRVIRSNGRIGGYNEGINKKMSLLKEKGVVIKNRKVVR